MSADTAMEPSTTCTATSEEQPPVTVDPHELVLTIDGVEKSFHDWTLEYVDRYFPRLEHSVYRVPPVQFNDPGRGLKTVEVHGQRYKILPEAESSHAQGNLATRVVCEALEDLGHQLGSLAIVSNFQFENYLNRVDMPPGLKLQKPEDKIKRGDVDVLVLNIESGSVVFEVKSVGYNVDWSDDHQEKLDRVRKQLFGELKGSGEKTEKKEKALDQVQKAKVVFEYIMNDLDPQPQAIMVVALPFVPRNILDEICVEIAEYDKSESICFLCQEDLISEVPGSAGLKTVMAVPAQRETAETSDEQPSKLRTWWEENVLSKKRGLTADSLKAIMGRFCGLLSTVSVSSLTRPRMEVRTQGEAVTETGRQFSAVVLTPEQLNVLQDEDDTAVGLRGPPGSGKSMLLALKGQQWLNQGHKIIVTVPQSKGGGPPCGFSLQKMLEEGVKKKKDALSVDVLELPVPGKFDFKVFDEKIETLGDIPRNHIHFLMDEFVYKDSGTEILQYLIEEKKVSVWWAMLHASDMSEMGGYKYHRLARTMRSPPSVQRLLEALEWNDEWKHSYTTSSEFEGLPTDGPPIATVHHAKHGSPSLPIECAQCADDIATFLIDNLGVGANLPVPSRARVGLHTPHDKDTTSSENVSPTDAESSAMAAGNGKKSTTAAKQKAKKKQANKPKCQAHVKIEDVILLFQTPMSMCVKISDNAYRVLREKYERFLADLSTGPFLTKLRERGLPVSLISTDNPRGVAVPAHETIPMTLSGLAWGLERTVVVYVATEIREDDRYQDPSVLGYSTGSASSGTTEASEGPSTADDDLPAAGKQENEDAVTEPDKQKEKSVLQIVNSLPPFHQKELFASASRSVSQFVLVIPTTWEK